MRDQVFLALDSLQMLPQPMMSILSEQIAAGLSRILVENPQAIRSATEWNLVFALWSATAAKEEAAVTSFSLISQLAAGQLAIGLNADNFVGFVRVLNDFATVAGAGDVKHRNSAAGWVVRRVDGITS
jgi:brefeldin A-resistance guanine nucleotide exchange factor 1